MGKYLDLDDVASGNPAAEQELAELRHDIERHIRIASEAEHRAQRAEALLRRARREIDDPDPLSRLDDDIDAYFSGVE